MVLEHFHGIYFKQEVTRTVHQTRHLRNKMNWLRILQKGEEKTQTLASGKKIASIYLH